MGASHLTKIPDYAGPGQIIGFSYGPDMIPEFLFSSWSKFWVVGRVKPISYIVYENLYKATVKKGVLNWTFLTAVETLIISFNTISMKPFFHNYNPMN